MTTLGWILILLAAVVVQRVTKGRSLTDIPKDLQDLFTATITGNTAGVDSVLQRSGDPAAAAASNTALSTTGDATATDTGSKVLAEAKRLGAGAVYVWGATGPTGKFDCSGLVWRAMKNTGVYNGPRFTTTTFAIQARSIATKVASPTIGDVVVWTGHMGIVDGPGTFYSALSKRSGIRTMPISGHSGTPTYYRLAGSVMA